MKPSATVYLVYPADEAVTVEPHSYKADSDGEHIEVLRFGECTIQMRRPQLLALANQLADYLAETAEPETTGDAGVLASAAYRYAAAHAPRDADEAIDQETEARIARRDDAEPCCR